MKPAKYLVLVVFVALFALVAAPGAAQDPLGKRVSLDFKAMAPADAFKTLADAVGLTVVVEPDVTAPVDVLVRNVRARTALDTICDSIECRWTLSGGVITVKGATDVRTRVTKKTARRVVTDQGIQAALKQPLPAGTRFEDTPLTEVAERLSQLSGVKIEVAGAEVAAAKVTADVSHLALVAALRRIVEPFSARMQVRLSATSSADGTMPTKVTIVIGGKAAVRKTARKEVKVK